MRSFEITVTYYCIVLCLFFILASVHNCDSLDPLRRHYTPIHDLFYYNQNYDGSFVSNISFDQLDILIPRLAPAFDDQPLTYRYCIIAVADVYNNMLVLYYERVFFCVKSEDPYLSFLSVKIIDIAADAAEEVKHVHIVYDEFKQSLTWYLHCQQLLHIDRIGLLPDNQSQPDPDLVLLLKGNGGEQQLVPHYCSDTPEVRTWHWHSAERITEWKKNFR